jgi:hypothetical protein
MFTAEEKYVEALRELKMRERVYPDVIAVGGMSAVTAQRRMAIMREIAEDYDKLAQTERLL